MKVRLTKVFIHTRVIRGPGGVIEHRMQTQRGNGNGWKKTKIEGNKDRCRLNGRWKETRIDVDQDGRKQGQMWTRIEDNKDECGLGQKITRIDVDQDRR